MDETAILELHQQHPVDGRALRQVCGTFVTGVTVITAGTGEETMGTTVNSFTSVSLDPPMVLFCLHKMSRLAPLIRAGEAYVVNLLAGRQERLAWAFAGRQRTHLTDVAHRRAANGVPVLDDALSFLACRVAQEVDGGDHIIFIGDVIELGIPRRTRKPLIFFGGAMGELEHETGADTPNWEA